MILVGLVFILEGLLCNFILTPNNETEYTEMSWVLLAVNILVMCLALMFSIKSEDVDEARYIKVVLLTTFALRILILMWDLYCRDIFILPNSEGDAEYYHSAGTSYAFGSRAEKVDYHLYPFWVGRIYKLFGVQHMTAQYLNIMLAMCSLVMVYKILQKFDINVKTRKFTMLIGAFLPNLMMITVFLLQESIISFFIISSLYMFTKWWFGGSPLNIVIAVLFSAAGAILHMGALTVGIGVLLMLVLLNKKDKIITVTPVKLLLVVVMAFAVLLVLTTFGDSLLGKLGGDISAENILAESAKREEGGGGYIIGIQGLPPAVDLVVNTPIRMFYFIFSPLPWMWRGLGDIVAFFGSTIFYICTVWTVVKAFRTKPNKTLVDDNIGSYLVVLTVVVLIASVMFGWGVSNSGSVLRHREKFTYICIVAFGVAQEIIYRVEQLNAEQKNIRNSTYIQGRKLSGKMR